MMIQSVLVRGFGPVSVSVTTEDGQIYRPSPVAGGWMAGGRLLSPAEVALIEGAIAAQKAAAMVDIVAACSL